MYPYISLDEIDPTAPDAFDKLNAFYHVQLDSLSFVLDQASELIESETNLNDDSNIKIGLGMLNTLGKRVEHLLTIT